MKKLSLDPEALAVESFATDEFDARIGLPILQPQFGDVVYGMDPVSPISTFNTPLVTIINCN
jgi:hypothetical protein